MMHPLAVTVVISPRYAYDTSSAITGMSKASKRAPDRRGKTSRVRVILYQKTFFSHTNILHRNQSTALGSR